MWTNFWELDVVKFCHCPLASWISSVGLELSILQGVGTWFWIVPLSALQHFLVQRTFCYLKFTLYNFLIRIMSSSFYSPTWLLSHVFWIFFPYKKCVFCVFTVWRCSVWIEQVQHSGRVFLCTWLRTRLSWATLEQFVKLVKLILVAQDFRVTSVAKLPLFCLSFCFDLGFFSLL